VGADAFGERAEQGQRMHPERHQLVGVDRVGADKAARQPGRAQGQAFGDVRLVVLPGGDF
jgi:hypothetical protein